MNMDRHRFFVWGILLIGLLGGCGESVKTTEKPKPEPDLNEPEANNPFPGVTDKELQELVDQQDELDETVYRFETQAQEHERTFVLLWDRLRNEEPWEVLQKFHFDTLKIGAFPGWKELDLGIPGMRDASLPSPAKEFSHEEYLVEIRKLMDQGWKIVQTEWHHSTFRPARNDRPATSLVSFELHAEQTAANRRVQIKGELDVVWSDHQTWDKSPYPGKIAVKKAVFTEQTGNPLFSEWMYVDPVKEVPKNYPRVSPVMVYDLNKDGLPEVILAGCNLMYWNRGGGKLEKAPFLKEVIMPLQEAAILADFNGDGAVDFVSTGLEEKKLRMWQGAADGTFEQPSQLIFDEEFLHPHVMTAGDIDGDGDLDLYVGQWKNVYERGSMPTPYYNALDGHPDYLLLNDGSGKFTDATEGTPVGEKRNHRTFSASFADLDEDGDLDLLTVADFSGLDVFQNDGRGKFTDVTDDWIDERHSFGMSHVLDDFDGDGSQDLYMVGMSSTTARRLERLGIRRDGFEKYDEKRMAMTFGNRLYLRKGGKFQEAEFRNDLARTGWSWGCATADFDNDGDRDLYVANGHLSGESARDYCTRFWCHDVYTGSSKPNPKLHAFYSTILGQNGWAIGKTVSWNGFEKNHLFLSDQGKGFRNVSFLTGSAYEFDARAVVATDLDMDGKPDLLVSKYDTRKFNFQLYGLKNQFAEERNWVGVRLQDEPGRPVIGAVVKVRAGGRTQSRQIVTGDSLTAQHPAILHFGLGKLDAVVNIEVRWQDGKTANLQNPKVNQYHLLTP
jgi:hypothetical protein